MILQTITLALSLTGAAQQAPSYVPNRRYKDVTESLDHFKRDWKATPSKPTEAQFAVTKEAVIFSSDHIGFTMPGSEGTFDIRGITSRYFAQHHEYFRGMNGTLVLVLPKGDPVSAGKIWQFRFGAANLPTYFYIDFPMPVTPVKKTEMYAAFLDPGRGKLLLDVDVKAGTITQVPPDTLNLGPDTTKATGGG